VRLLGLWGVIWGSLALFCTRGVPAGGALLASAGDPKGQPTLD